MAKDSWKIIISCISLALTGCAIISKSLKPEHKAAVITLEASVLAALWNKRE
ncbi:hypothetical protein M1N88_03330 [Dehalococcoidia bacterium]|nr:hypothetical protein [Dehalococcoidia bacterium]